MVRIWPKTPPFLSERTMSQSLVWIWVWVNAIWPLVVMGPYVVTRLRRQKVRGGKWRAFYLFYTAAIIVGVFLHYNMLGPEYRPLRLHNYRGLGLKAGFSLTTMERWLVLGAFVSLITAFRGYWKLGETERWLLRK